MIITKRKGQLSLEFILLILGLMVAGTVVSMGLVEQSPKFLGNEASNIKKESMGAFVTEAKFDSANSDTIINDSNPQPKTNETNETEEQSTPQDKQELPDLTPISLIVAYTNGTKICHYCKEHVQNSGENQQLQNQFRHGCCKNNTQVKISTVIKNVGNASAGQFVVALYDNDEKVAEQTISGLGVNDTTSVIFNYIISTSKGCKNQHQYQNHGANSQQQYQHHGCGGGIYEHTIKIVVDEYNSVNESNENNNEISVEINITKGHGHHGHEDANKEINSGIASDLKIYIGGYAFGEITKDIISGGKYISGNINEKIKGGGKVGKYNVNGTISGKIKVNGNSKLYLGNLYSINALTLTPEGNSETHIKVPEIGTLEIKGIKGYSWLELKGSKVNTIKVTKHIEGNGYFMCQEDTIDYMYISSIKGYAILDLIKNKIDNLCINRVEGNAYMYISSSDISKLRISDSLKGYSTLNIWDGCEISEVYIKGMQSDSTLIIGDSKINKLTINGNMGYDAVIYINNANITTLHVKRMNWGAIIEITNSNVENIIIDEKNKNGAKIIIDENSKVGNIEIKKEI
ncbi:APHP domain protein [Methanocaldococcus sp. FS406-22]|uniref:CARDB domain-containing protein n=1 Tax=Methanocaldococcus sp. (strain FS406-22) TaxID=644281 RepID=UPI0001BF4BCD|nr:CARDB domain-containing protein [Methanocaldococcus sp. FS406-22]ADC69643.1 APHP domain protein [Methanocaldococcus sp. FS406-22]